MCKRPRLLSIQGDRIHSRGSYPFKGITSIQGYIIHLRGYYPFTKKKDSCEPDEEDLISFTILNSLRSSDL